MLRVKKLPSGKCISVPCCNPKKEIKEIVFDDDSNSGDSPPQTYKKHPSAYHTSRILDDEIAKSKSLKSIDSLLGGLDINDF